MKNRMYKLIKMILENYIFFYIVIKNVMYKNKKYLYYCSECLKEQLDLYGEGNWNRIFLLLY